MTDRHRFRLATGLGVATVAGFGVVLLARPGGKQGTLWVDDGVTLLAALVAAAAAAIAAWRGGRADRHGWALIAAGLVSWSFGEAVWAWYELGPRGAVPFPSLADAGYLLAVPLTAVGVASFSSGGRLADRTRALLDGLVVAGSLTLVSWIAVLGPVFRANSATILSRAISVAYPAGDVVIGTIVVSSLARTRRFRGNPLVLVGLALIAMAVSDSVYAWMTQAGTYTTGNLIDIGWVAGYVLIGLAALRALTVASSQPADDVAVPLPTILLPYGALALAFGVGVGAVLTDRGADTGLVIAGGVLAAFVVVRQLVTLLDNRRLTATLQGKVAELDVRDRELERLAFQDTLTGLANRAAFLHRVTAAAERRESTPLPISVLLIDLDDFKTVNDSLGHAAGDELLVEVAVRIRSCAAASVVARLGGDEFGVLLDGDRDESPAAVAARIQAALRAPIAIADRQMVARASIGITHSDTGHIPADELLRQADTAMFAAKQRGKDCSEVFSTDLLDGATERRLLRSALAAALGTDALTIHYQPIVELVSGRVWAVEALSRWTDHERGAVPPAEFIPLSEESGMIHDLGRWVLLHACEEAVGWPGGASAPVLSVNVSAAQLADDAFVASVSEALAMTGLPAERLMVEVTESVLHHPADFIAARLAALRDLGVRVAIDDYGTGHTSLRHLAQFSVDVIKIDQTLLRRIDDGPAGVAVLRAIIDVADQLGLDTVAEGIEEIRQADALASIGCRSGQGFWYRRPVPASLLWPLPSGAVVRPRRTRAEPAMFPRR